MDQIIWHNPRCSKSRKALKYFQEKGYNLSIRLYIKDQPKADELSELHKKLGMSVVEFTRTGDALFRKLSLDVSDSDSTLLAAMAKHPALIERPIIFANGKARIGRPPENALDIL